MLKQKQKRVAHFVRKLLPSSTSFIRNQIMNHIKYAACVIYKEYIECDFSREIIRCFPSFYCDVNKNGIKEKYSKFLYNNFRILTGSDKRNILAFVHANKVDILHFHYGTDAGVFLSIAKRLNVPSVVSFYGYDCSSFPHRYFGYGKRYLQTVFKYTDYCLAMSDDMKSDLLKIGCPENKIIVHYCGSDLQSFCYNRKYEAKDNINFLILASLVHKKGHLFLLQAFKKALKLTNKLLKLRIVGEGDLEYDLRKFVKKNNLLENVCFVGSLKHLSKEYLQEFYQADVFIHPSITSQNKDKEGIPSAIVEAMAMQLPVISTFHAGIPYIIHHGQNGYLVNEWDINRLAEYICIFAEDVELRKKIGKRAQKYAFEKLDLKCKERELESIYDYVIENHNKRSKIKPKVFSRNFII